MRSRSARLALAVAVTATACSSDKDEVVTVNRDSYYMAPDTVADFRRDAIYTGEPRHAPLSVMIGGRVIEFPPAPSIVGTRWVHKTHGMPVTVLRIQSVPQVFLAFNTPPVSDRGEPHTGEHLLLGKGGKGKMLSLEQEMSLVESTAWTSQTDVCYSWSCAAGKETFFRSVEQYLDALLLPDYSDEEIRREVCHVGPVKDDATGKLSLDEKGTVYQEMVSTSAKRWLVWNEMQRRLWGKDHPLSYDSGGTPAALRTMTPRHIRDFQEAHYHLGADTQMIVALPDSIPETEFLTRLSAQMAEVDARPEMKSRGKDAHPMSPGRPDADRSVRVYPYPNANEDDGGSATVMWAPVPLGAQADRVFAELLINTLASGQSATLYKRLMDGATREVPVDAADMGCGLDASKIDLLPYMYFDGLPARNANAEQLGKIVGVVRDEIARVAALPAGSAELKAFNEKALVKLTEREKGLKRQLNAPPLFGHRNAGGFWLDHLRLLDQGGGAERSVALAPVFADIRAKLASAENHWTQTIRAFGLDQAPFVGASAPSKAELEKREREHAARVAGYVADETKRRGGGDEQAALAKFAAEYDANTAEIADAEKNLPKPKLVADVPLTSDPSIKLEPVDAGGAKGFRGVFDNMTFAETSLSFDLGGVAPSGDCWLAILPRFLTESGVVVDGKPVPYDVANERRAKEIYGLSAGYSMRPSKGRHELRVTASGADLAESKRAVEWLELCLSHPWTDAANVARLRDLVAQEIQATRGRLGGSEESWVEDPADAVRWQGDSLYLATSSIHARLFLLARCEWRLMDKPATKHEAVAVMKGLISQIELAAGSDAKSTVAHLDGFVARWKESKDAANVKWLVPIALRIKEMVGDMAPATIERDLRALVAECQKDLAVGPDAAVQEFESVRQAIVLKDRLRFAMTGSRASTDALLPSLARFVGTLGTRQYVRDPRGEAFPRLVDLRLADHEPAGAKPVHYGLVNDAGTTGVFVNGAKAGGLDDLDEATLRTELAGRVFGGAGPHAFFMKTWGAGLAYSNGLGMRPSESRIRYYAERCPDLVQTMSFVTGLVRDAGGLDDPYLAEYCVANAVALSRESDEYETRTRAAADDVTDGDTPERVAKYRRAILALKDRPDLWTSMKPQIVDATGRVLPGIGPKSRDVEGGSFFVIAPEPMLAKWEKYVRDAEGADERVVRIFGRDFWRVAR